MLKKFCLILIIFFTSFCFAKTQKEEYQNDYLYSEAYFDYLIECAENDRDEEIEKQKQGNNTLELELVEDEQNQDVISQDFEPFRLRIETDEKILPYSETFRKINTKTIIPVNDKFSFTHDMSKARNKYNSTDYKILAGAEYNPNRFLNFSGGLETNFRGLDQNPTSRKLYFTPGIKFSDKVSLIFPNKINVQNYSTDHDIGVNISPFKSKVMDFGVYSGLTKAQNGSISQSVNFSTSFYFF